MPKIREINQMPPEAEGGAEEQLAALRDYLVKTMQELCYLLTHLDTANIDEIVQRLSAMIPSKYTGTPSADGDASAGNTGKWADGGHVHPTDTSRASADIEINGHALTDDITLDAADVGAVPSTDKGAAGGVASLDSGGKVPAAQLPAYPVVPGASTANPAMDGTASPGSTGKWADGGHVHPTDTSRVPTSRKINGYDLTQDRTLNASDVGALAAAAAAVSAKSLSFEATIGGNAGWYKFYEHTLAGAGKGRNLILEIADAISSITGFLRVYHYKSTASADSVFVRWVATTSPLDNVRWTVSQGVLSLYIYKNYNGANQPLVIGVIAAYDQNGAAVDVSGNWTSVSVSEPTNATAATGTISNYAARATSDGAGNNIAAGRLWFEAQVVSAGTAQQILSISDAKITADYVLARIEFADPSYITTGYSWATASGSFTLTGTATAATTANVLLVRKGN